MRPGLFAKGMILVSIPLVMQLITITLFANMYRSIKTTLDYQMTATRAIMIALHVSSIFDEVGVTLFRVNGTKLDSSPDYGSMLALLEELSSELVSLKTVGPPFDDIASCTAYISKRLLEFNMAVVDAAARNDLYSDKIMAMGDTARLDVTRKIAWLTDRIIALSDKPVMALIDTRSLITGVMLSTIFINLVTAIVLGLVIRRNVILQLKRMEANIQRLGDHQELLKPLEGNDKVALFDRSFHAIVLGVRAARLERHVYMELMSSSLRTPLVEMEAFISLARANAFGQPNSKGEASLSAASRSLKRLVTMLNELIDFDEIDRGVMSLTPKDVSPNALLDDAVECLKVGGPQAEIVVEHIESETSLHADPDRVLRVLINLLNNAVKFSPEHTQITLSARQTPESTFFSIQDQGSGIAEDLKDKIFSRFEQVNQSSGSKNQKGSGLGLFICKTIVEAHGGEIWVSSTQGQGSTFTFSIPN